MKTLLIILIIGLILGGIYLLVDLQKNNSELTRATHQRLLGEIIAGILLLTLSLIILW